MTPRFYSPPVIGPAAPQTVTVYPHPFFQYQPINLNFTYNIDSTGRYNPVNSYGQNVSSVQALNIPDENTIKTRLSTSHAIGVGLKYGFTFGSLASLPIL